MAWRRLLGRARGWREFLDNGQAQLMVDVGVDGGAGAPPGALNHFHEGGWRSEACRLLAGIDRLIDAVEVAAGN